MTTVLSYKQERRFGSVYSLFLGILCSAVLQTLCASWCLTPATSCTQKHFNYSCSSTSVGWHQMADRSINPLNAELNPICHLLALLGVHFLHVSRIRVKSLTLRLLVSIYIYIYMEHLFLMFLDHTQRRTTVGRTPLDE